uniref:Uncharacterized protein ycf33 n=1 Tax=Polysiphonia scopulorum TaxID=257860 RepID=A0A1Z1MHX4_9FLOR|nr:hypothetical protein [Polysiphonia scopulorum]ARW65668.1 hypothetical protein [Polysiphonia scopulorum]
MTDFWVNLYKFPRFLISVLIGFFLTTLKPIFKLLKKKESSILITSITLIITAICYKILRKMTGLD